MKNIGEEVLQEDVEKYIESIRKYVEENQNTIMLSSQEQDLLKLFRELSKGNKENLMLCLKNKLNI